MLFHSPGFLLLFLPIFLLLIFLSPTGWMRRLVLCFFSYLFYSGSSPFFVVLLFFSSCVDYLVGLRLSHSERPLIRKLLLTISIIVNLGLLGFYKYGGMFAETYSSIGELLGLPTIQTDFFQSIILPAGISFYTFQSMSYSIDLYRRQIPVERDFFAFLNYVAYLPQLIAGPIERYSKLHPQLVSFVEGESTPSWKLGFDRLGLGIAQKLLIADSCGFIVDTLLAQPMPLTFLQSWAVAIGFGMQIFYDFSAYTHMAIGISLFCGVRLSHNFRAPYQAENIQEFWRRWHMTLSTWFRDYVYIPLGGSKQSVFRKFTAIFITFLVSGLWHGASWSFVLWGAFHGILLIIFLLMPKNISVPHIIGVCCTFILVHYGWILFRVQDLEVISSLWLSMSGVNGFTRGAVSIPDLFFLGLVVVGTLVARDATRREPGASGYLESFGIWVLAIFALTNSPELVQFIYFQF